MPDVFVCHASEDKDAIARPLALMLMRRGYEVWYDEYSLKVGDSLRRTIDRGLATSKFGIVILSPAFFDKRWTQYELDGLIAQENADGRKRVLPVWHRVTLEEVSKYSPPLAARKAVASAEGIDIVADHIVDALGGVTPASSSGRRKPFSIGIVGTLSAVLLVLATLATSAVRDLLRQQELERSIAVPDTGSVRISANGIHGILVVTPPESFRISWETIDLTACRLDSPSGFSGVSVFGSDGPISPEDSWYPTHSRDTVIRISCTDGVRTEVDSVVVRLASRGIG